MNTCHEFNSKILDYVLHERNLSRTENGEVHDHLESCEECRELEESYRFMKGLPEPQNFLRILEIGNMRADTLVTCEELFAFFKIKDGHRTSELRKHVNKLVTHWTEKLYGEGWRDELGPEHLEEAASRISALAGIELFEPQLERRQILNRIIHAAEYCTRSTYQLIRLHLKRVLGIDEHPKEIRILRAAKGEFAHWDEVKNRFALAKTQGPDVRILKGIDDRLDFVAREAEVAGIPCRSWKPSCRTRYYRVNNSYLLLFSHEKGQFTFFGGEDPEGAQAVEDLFQFDWARARPANRLAE